MSAKLTALTAITAPALTDLVYVVTDPSGVPLSQKCTIEDIFAAGTLPIGNDVFLVREAANVLGQRNGVTSQAFEVYHTFTDAGNYQRATLKNNAGSVELAAETLGTGADNIDVLLTPAGTGRVNAAGVTMRSGELTGEIATNGLATFYINYYGYANGTTQFRDLSIADGKGNDIAYFTGSTKEASFLGNVRLAHSTLTYAGSTAIDFRDTAGYQTCALTGNITFTTSNLAAGRSKTIRIQADGSNRTFTFPAWIFVGSAAPAQILANKTAILTITSFGATDANCVAAYSEEP